ncbi:uncharacterized protein [Littorina saxatilis]|uniref:uncharacterized protein n=1 Tax=Littorina saxatilis TaxID=31220 RepID=UPI0038B6081C
MLPWTGLREALEKGEEDKPDSDESGDEEADDNKKGKGKGKKKDKKKGGGNKVAPCDEVDQAEEKTVVEYLEVPPNTCKANGESPGGESLKVEEVEMAVPGTSAP